ncbi:MAG: D-aminoacylase [Acidobacteria bacterium]|nr:MAG: D-aminoacylase [Acidobacteriota bacterium]
MLLAAGVLTLGLAPAPQPEFDLLITGGRLLDGGGNPWVSGSVAVKGDRIARVGRFTATAVRVIDATGLYVSPGFVDIMDQSGPSLRRDGTAQSKVRQGVTTAIGGEGGTPGAPAELDQYFATIERQGISLNFGTFVSAEQARTAVLGAVNREPDAAELERMKAVIEAAMQRGALGMTTALIYEPGSFAKTPELIALARVAAGYGGIYATHVRDEGLGVLQGIAEAIEIGEKAGIPVEIFHLKVAHRKLWKTAMPQIDELVRAARARGVDVTADQYPYPFSGTGLETCIPDWVAEGGVAKRNKRLQDPALRDRLRAEIARLDRVQAIGDWKNVVITSVPAGVEANYVGMTVADIARERKQAPEETVMDLVSATGGRVSALFFLMDEADVRTAMTYPWVSVGSDAQAYDAATAQGRPHPRGYGTFPRIIARYVREARVLTLENAVRRMTSLPAGKLHLAGRGVLAEGAFADLVLFDYDRIEDTATYQQPHQYPKGIPYVIVNGQLVVDKGEHTGARPGRVIRGGQ